MCQLVGALSLLDQPDTFVMQLCKHYANLLALPLAGLCPVFACITNRPANLIDDLSARSFTDRFAEGLNARRQMKEHGAREASTRATGGARRHEQRAKRGRGAGAARSAPFSLSGPARPTGPRRRVGHSEAAKRRSGRGEPDRAEPTRGATTGAPTKRALRA